jgi:nucleoside-diphosphate-sugar epimerase
MSQQRILITGANGFVGRALCAYAVAQGYIVIGITRSLCSLPKGVKNVVVGDIDNRTIWRDVLLGGDLIVHLAARAHVMSDTAVDPLEEFRRINMKGTLNLAGQAADAGVRRFVFVSSIGVNGVETFQRPFRAEDEGAPQSPYAVSKYEAELGLQALAARTEMEVVIIRPPLVYGSGAPGNFASLMRWLQRGVPLPLGAIHNQRSLVALDNLVDLLVTCLRHPAAANQIFLVSDGEDVSTPELLRHMGQAMGRPARLIPVPASLLKLVAAMIGKQDMAQRLCGSLQIDMSKTEELLGWRPPFSVDEALKKAAEGYVHEAVF